MLVRCVVAKEEGLALHPPDPCPETLYSFSPRSAFCRWIQQHELEFGEVGLEPFAAFVRNGQGLASARDWWFAAGELNRLRFLCAAPITWGSA